MRRWNPGAGGHPPALTDGENPPPALAQGSDEDRHVGTRTGSIRFAKSFVFAEK